MEYIVYKTTNLINNKIYIGVHKTEDSNVFDGYIGCGIYINRPSSYQDPTTPLQYAVIKYGFENFKRETIKVFKTSNEAYQLEETLVNYNFINRSDTYNAKLGGMGGSSYCITTYQYNKTGELVNTWDSIMEASEYMGVSHTAISNAIKYKGSCKGFFWTKEYISDFSLYSYNNSKVLCFKYDINGKLIESYESIKQAADLNNSTPQNIRRAINSGYKVNNYYYSKELVEVFIPPKSITLKNKILYVYSLEGIYLCKLETKEEILNFFQVKTYNTLLSALRSNRPYKNYQLSLDFVDILPSNISLRNNARPIECYNLDNKLIEVMPSITKAKEKYGSGVASVLEGKIKSSKGFIFKYQVKDIV